MDWLKTLERSHKLIEEQHEESVSRTGYLFHYLFEIITYDSEQDEIIGKKMLEVIDAITEGTTFDYIKNEVDYTLYLMFCNFRFLADRIGWGTSIRGAWWDFDIKFSTCGLFCEDGEQRVDWRFSREQWEQFMRACVEYAKGESDE